jgi:hypothetical protein
MAPQFFLLLVSLPARISNLSMHFFSVFLNAAVYSNVVLGRAVNLIITDKEVTI